MRRENGQDGFREDLLPTEEEVSSYNPHEGECCTLVNFRPDLRQRPRSQYNLSAARVFSKGFKDYQNYSNRDTNLVGDTFIVHLRYLQRKFKASMDKRKAEVKRRDQRRRKVRYIICITNCNSTIFCSFSKPGWSRLKCTRLTPLRCSIALE